MSFSFFILCMCVQSRLKEYFSCFSKWRSNHWSNAISSAPWGLGATLRVSKIFVKFFQPSLNTPERKIMFSETEVSVKKLSCWNTIQAITWSFNLRKKGKIFLYTARNKSLEMKKSYWEYNQKLSQYFLIHIFVSIEFSHL